MVPSGTTQGWVHLWTSLLAFDMASNYKSRVKFVHQFATLKGKQLAIAIEILVICLNLSNVSSVESPSVDSIEEVVEVLD